MTRSVNPASPQAAACFAIVMEMAIQDFIKEHDRRPNETSTTDCEWLDAHVKVLHTQYNIPKIVTVASAGLLELYFKPSLVDTLVSEFTTIFWETVAPKSAIDAGEGPPIVYKRAAATVIAYFLTLLNPDVFLDSVEDEEKAESELSPETAPQG